MVSSRSNYPDTWMTHRTCIVCPLRTVLQQSRVNSLHLLAFMSHLGIEEIQLENFFIAACLHKFAHQHYAGNSSETSKKQLSKKHLPYLQNQWMLFSSLLKFQRKQSRTFHKKNPDYAFAIEVVPALSFLQKELIEWTMKFRQKIGKFYIA